MAARNILSPDELAKNVIDEVSYRKGKVSISEFWEIASSFVDLRDDFMKRFMFLTVSSHPDTVVLVLGKAVANLSYDDVLRNESDVQISITDDRLWLTLTGHTKKEASIVGFAFDLLLEVASSKERGINTMDLARITGQDPRSVTGRIKKFSHLVTMNQLVYKGHLVKSLTLNRFVTEKPTKSYVNLKHRFPDIVEIVKNSKNGVRQVIDLKREMGFDKDKRLLKAFTSAISWLGQQGYLKKVIVVSPANPSIKIRCVQFVKSYAPEETAGNNPFEDDSADEDELDDQNGEDHDTQNDDLERNALEEDELVEGFDKFNATNILQDSNLVIQENIFEKKQITLNRFYPLQTQVYAMADQAGTNGISTLDLIARFVGPDYKRCFSKNTEYFIEGTSQKSSKPNSDAQELGLVKIYDFEGKKKFHRIFTKRNFVALTDQMPSRTEKSSLPPIIEQPYTLEELSRKNFVPLNASLRYVNDGEQDIFFWHGELDIPASSISSVRGRKRVTLPDMAEKPKRIKTTQSIADLKVESEDALLLKNTNHITMNGFTGSSLKSIQRQKALLTVLRNSGGVRFIGDQLYDSISKHMGTDMTLDKKTLKKESELLIASGKLRVIEDPMSKKRLLCLPDVSKEKVEEYIFGSKDTRGRFNTEVVCKEDIYFFDQAQKDRFHRSANSAKRLKDFERNNKQTKSPSSVSVDIEQSTVTRKLRKKMPAKPKSDPLKETKSRISEGSKAPRSTFHSGTKEGMTALIYAIVITKSIKGQIDWEAVTKLFPHNALENLKKQWRIRRVRMGESGWRALMEKWRKVMVEAVKDERASLSDAENLNLLKLVHLWLSDENDSSHSVKLFKNYDANRLKYTFLPPSNSSKTEVRGKGVAMSSMIQRENFLMNKKYFVGSHKSRTTTESVEDEIRTVVRSMLFEKSSVENSDVDILQKYNTEQVDKVILDMARDRLVTFLDSSKLQLSEKLYDFLKYYGDTSFLQRSSDFRKKVVELFNNKNALVISDEPSRHVPCVLTDLIGSFHIQSEVVPLEVQHKKMYYTTRQYEVRALTPPMVFYSSTKIKEKQAKWPKIPSDEAFSRLWVNANSEVRLPVWRAVLSVILKEIMFSPGITIPVLTDRMSTILSPKEIYEIIDWLEATQRISTTEFGGYVVCNGWYSALG